MKSSFEKTFMVFITSILVLTTTKNLQSQTQGSKIKGQDIWEKTITYHDPYGNWKSYKGIMQEVTVFPNNYVVKETIEINKPDDYYLSTCFQEFGTIKRGMDKGKPFFSLNDDPNVSEEIRNNWGLSDTGITLSKEWHTDLFGLPMQLKQSGMKVQENVKIIDFEDKKCYELIFIGMPNMVNNKNYVGKLIIYTDPETNSMRGTRWELSGQPAFNVVFSKEIEINGIRIPHVMICYNAENGTQRFASINNPLKK